MIISTRNMQFKHSLAFVLGFSLIFVFLGISAGAFGRLVPGLLPLIRRVGGVILILFGLVMIGLIGWLSGQIQSQPGWREHSWSRGLVRSLDTWRYLLYADRRVQWRPNSRENRRGYSASFMTGIIFSAGWSPCLGPILSAILLLAAEQQTIGQASALMIIYTAGLAIPFLITGAALGRVSGFLRRINRRAKIISIISGGFLIFTGYLLVSDLLLELSAELIYVLGIGFGLEEVLLGAAAISIPLALIAGILSFFSPCVLPLVPAYIGYISGTALDPESTGIKKPASAATIGKQKENQLFP